MTDENKTILVAMGKRLRAFRKDKGMSREYVAGELGITVRTYASYERGEHDIPLEALLKLAPMFHTTLANLIDYEKETHI